MFANHSTDETTRLLLINFFNAQNTTRSNDNTTFIYTSADGAAGSQVSVYKSALFSALTVNQDRHLPAVLISPLQDGRM